MHVNWFFSKIVNNQVEYFPAEYAIGVFSLEKGIEDMHHVIVSAKIPLGYRREAMEMSQSGHSIPVEYSGGEVDFAVMYKNLVDFLEPRKLVDKYPPIYATTSCIKPVTSLLKRLSEAARKDTYKELRHRGLKKKLCSFFLNLALGSFNQRGGVIDELALVLRVVLLPCVFQARTRNNSRFTSWNPCTSISRVRLTRHEPIGK